VKYVLLYETARDAMPKAQLHFPAHSARLQEFHAKGSLLMVGAFENPLDGAMGIFTTREAAEEFVKGDPFVVHGVVKSWVLRGWNEIFAGP